MSQVPGLTGTEATSLEVLSAVLLVAGDIPDAEGGD
jgi:hypothetical protein